MKKIYIIYEYGTCQNPYCDGTVILSAFSSLEKAEEYKKWLEGRWTGKFDIKEMEVE